MVECKIKPSIQGDLDNLCGIYSLVNIVAYLYDGRFKRRKLKFELLRRYKERWQIDQLLEQGLDELEMDYLIESTFRQGFYQQHYPLTFTTPYRNQSPLRTTQIIKEMRQFLHDPNYKYNRAILIADQQHWSVIRDIDRHFVYYFDSCGVNKVQITSFSLIKNRTRYQLLPAYIYFVERSV